MSTPRLILASGSPRRKDLLERLGLTFAIQPADIDETPGDDEAPVPLVERLALSKARAVLAATEGPRLILAADTIVVRDDVILNKPVDVADARAILCSLQGRSHVVITGFALARDDGREHVQHVRTQVTFRPLSDALIADYVATGEPMDKAGAYGVQEIGAKLVSRIEGSYTNVVGLPLVEVLDALPTLGGPRL